MENRNKQLIKVARKVVAWLQNADLADPKAEDAAQDLANELETAINESIVQKLIPEFSAALKKAGYIEGGKQ